MSLDSLSRTRALNGLLEILDRKHSLLPAQGFESRVYDTGATVLKVPKPFLLRGMDRSAEYLVRRVGDRAFEALCPVDTGVHGRA